MAKGYFKEQRRKPVKRFKLQSARKALGYTAEEFSYAVGVSASVISGYEQGRMTPPLPNAIRISMLLGIDIFDLFPDIVESCVTKILELPIPQNFYMPPGYTRSGWQPVDPKELKEEEDDE